MWTFFALPKTFFLLLHHHHRPNNPSSRDHRVWCPLSSPLSKLDLINLWEPQRRRRRLPEAREKRGGGLVSKKHRKKRTGEKFFFRLNFFSGSLFPLLDSSRARCLRCLLQLSRGRKHLFAPDGKASVRKYVFQTKYIFSAAAEMRLHGRFFRLPTATVSGSLSSLLLSGLMMPSVFPFTRATTQFCSFPLFGGIGGEEKNRFPYLAFAPTKAKRNCSTESLPFYSHFLSFHFKVRVTSPSHNEG